MEEKKLIFSDKSFAGLRDLIPNDTLSAAAAPSTGGTGSASGASGTAKAAIDNIANTMLTKLEQAKATEGKKEISKLQKQVAAEKVLVEKEKDLARKDEEKAEEARELSEQNPSKENEEAADKAEEKALVVEEKARKLEAVELVAKKKEAAMERAIATGSSAGTGSAASPLIKLLTAMSKASTGPSAGIAANFLREEEKVHIWY